MKDEDYYDVPMTLEVVISVSAADEKEAVEKLYAMDDEDLVCLLAEQVHFIGMNESDTLQQIYRLLHTQTFGVPYLLKIIYPR